MAPEVNLDGLVITEAAWPYLVAQNGALDSLKRDRQLWTAAYKQKLLETYRNIEPWLPPLSAPVSLDVGCGMGGINILLAQHYGLEFTIALLDGEDDPPEMHLHRETFSNYEVASRFLIRNGVRNGCNANRTSGLVLDVVTSFGAWCFHLPPSLYLPWILERTRPSSRFILEVRSDKPEWREELDDRLNFVALIHEGRKWNRIVYDCKA